MRVLRIYFTEFDNEKYGRVVNKLKSLGFKVVEHKSMLVPEFRYLEIMDFQGDPDTVRREIVPLIEAREYLKLDVVEVVTPKRGDADA